MSMPHEVKEEAVTSRPRSLQPYAQAFAVMGVSHAVRAIDGAIPILLERQRGSGTVGSAPLSRTTPRGQRSAARSSRRSRLRAAAVGAIQHPHPRQPARFLAVVVRLHGVHLWLLTPRRQARRDA
jgi:hypothetical protein